MIQSVRTNKEFLSKCEIDGANKARKYQEVLGWEISDTMKRLVTENHLLCCDITVDDITRAVEIYGKAVPILKGKMIRPLPKAHEAIVRIHLDY